MGYRSGTLEEMVVDTKFWKDKRVFLTGHTGFKGTWLCAVLNWLGARVTGFAMVPPTDPSLFALSAMETRVHSVMGDIRDQEALTEAFAEAKPEVVIHMAAQPIVRDSYKDPRYTYETNVMGTVNILECVRLVGGVRSFLNVTTDKVYQNNEWNWGYREIDRLDGIDPYSNSKSCSELVTHSYQRSFFSDKHVAISTARAGNVIGGGDFAKDRIIPDCVRHATRGEPIIVRNPFSVRPYQHVLEPLYAYLLVLQRQWGEPELAGCYNIGPNQNGCVTTGTLVDLFCEAWGHGQSWVSKDADGPHEANFLKLDCSKIKATLGWAPHLTIGEAIRKTVAWTRAWQEGEDIFSVMEEQVAAYAKAVPGGKVAHG